ncbi:MAG: Na+-transporting methylmalonyl-CoA/oxaloacetate decarboxylase gamma subunit [Kiritimatiellia bacterium]|jgi:Na+-transporting methylmalonyl-CoA/oxaloacetate decarboxylase gamma subunit
MNFTFDWNNVTEVNGLGITLTGMVIVLLALTLITLYITILPKVLKLLAPILPKEHVAHKKEVRPNDQDPLIAAAAAAAWHKHQHGEQG